MKANNQRPLLAVLALIQFVHVLDFVLVMPLGAYLMRDFSVGPKSLAAFVSAYNLAAAGSGLVGAWWLDRFDRRTSLLLAMAGFTLGTLGCALATGPTSLIFARLLAGCFGGLIQALLFAIIGDCFSEDHRGAATGTVMSAFSLASVVGVPVSLWLADRSDWRAPFLALSLLSFAIWLAAAWVLPSLRGHMTSDLGPSSRGVPAVGTPAQTTLELIRDRNSQVGFALIVSLMFAGFTVIPFMSAYLVANAGLREADLAIVFLSAGAATLFTSRLAGTLADRFGKPTVFAWLATLSIVPTLLLTRLGQVSIGTAVLVSALFTVCVSARAVPVLAMITSSAESASRGRYLSLTSSVQQAASGLASMLGGFLLVLESDGRMANYEVAGWISAIFVLLAIWISRHLRARS